MSRIKRMNAGLAASALMVVTLLLCTYSTYLVNVPTSADSHAIGKIKGKSSGADHHLPNAKFRNHATNHTNTKAKLRNPAANLTNTHPETVSCKPRRNIVFLKLHKCSSSTVQNILLRYGEEHKLDFVLPQLGNYLDYMSGPFNKKMIMNFPVKKYNILCHHTRFNYREMSKVVPREVLYTTMIRDPVAMYESLFTYHDMAGLYHLPRDKALEIFLEEPDYYYGMAHGGKWKARNPMLFDLGLAEKFLSNEEKVITKIQELKTQFHLVLLTEYFEQSLVLLRDSLCWDLDDMVYFILNARNKSSVKTVSHEMADKIRSWNFGDVKLYEMFNQTFWRKVEAFGHQRMGEEVRKLRERNKYFKDHCIAKVVNHDSSVWHPPHVEIDSYRLKPEATKNKTCVRMVKTELPYTDHIRNIQRARYGLL